MIDIERETRAELSAHWTMAHCQAEMGGHSSPSKTSMSASSSICSRRESATGRTAGPKPSTSFGVFTSGTWIGGSDSKQSSPPSTLRS